MHISTHLPIHLSKLGISSLCVPHITYISKIPTKSTYLLAQTTCLHAYMRLALQANSNLFSQSLRYNYKITYLYFSTSLPFFFYDQYNTLFVNPSSIHSLWPRYQIAIFYTFPVTRTVIIYALLLTFHCPFYFPLRYEDKFLKNQVLLSLIRPQIFSLELPAEALRTFSRKSKIFRNTVRKAIINEVK